MRAGSSVAVPQTLGEFATGLGLTIDPMVTFAQSSLAAFTVHEGSRKHAVQVATLPLR